LEDAEDVEVFVNEEQFHFVNATRVSDTENDKFHDLLIHIDCGEVSQVNLESNFKRIILDTSHEKINEMIVLNLRNISS